MRYPSYRISRYRGVSHHDCHWPSTHGWQYTRVSLWYLRLADERVRLEGGTVTASLILRPLTRLGLLYHTYHKNEFPVSQLLLKFPPADDDLIVPELTGPTSPLTLSLLPSFVPARARYITWSNCPSLSLESKFCKHLRIYIL